MEKRRDLTGMKAGRLICIKPVGVSANRSILWLCKCECGNEAIVQSSRLITGRTLSCGCLQRESAVRIGTKKKTHGFWVAGLTGSGAYKSWAHLKERCQNSKCKSYANYGGRGIAVCEKWLTFEGFWEDMGPTYKKGLSIDRIDNNGNYEPSNCRWADSKTQSMNKRNNVFVEYNGQSKSIGQWAIVFGIKASTITTRLANNWSIEMALTTPVMNKKAVNT